MSADTGSVSEMPVTVDSDSAAIASVIGIGVLVQRPMAVVLDLHVCVRVCVFVS